MNIETGARIALRLQHRQLSVPTIPADMPEWRKGALCTQFDPDLFYPDSGACDWRTECLTWALDHNERYGVWGGMSERDRRQLRRGAA